jgi:hypothetical protein
MNEFKFTTIWKFRGSLYPVWEAIIHTESWPEWWKGVKFVKPVTISSSLRNAVYEFKFQRLIPYSVNFRMKIIKVIPEKSIKGIAWGDLEGTGNWSFRQKQDEVIVRYDWDVKAVNRWMKVLSKIIRPFFILSHNLVMLWGAKGLAKKLNVKLLDHKTISR